jgi:hypothetical protein
MFELIITILFIPIVLVFVIVGLTYVLHEINETDI